MADLTLVDSSVIIDVAAKDPFWGGWSCARLDEAFLEGRAAINAVIYAEVTSGYASAEDFNQALEPYAFVWEDIPREAAFLAGKMYRDYRRRGGARRSILPDFLIGAHAVQRGMALLTRDRVLYRTFFPDIEVIMPNFDPKSVL